MARLVVWRFEFLRARQSSRPRWETGAVNTREAVEEFMEFVLQGWEGLPLHKRPPMRLVAPDSEVVWQNFEELERGGKMRYKVVR